MTTRNLASPVIIRPKHGAFKGVPLVAVKGDTCADCIYLGIPCVDDIGVICLKYDCHYELAEGGKHDKG